MHQNIYNKNGCMNLLKIRIVTDGTARPWIGSMMEVRGKCGISWRLLPVSFLGYSWFGLLLSQRQLIIE